MSLEPYGAKEENQQKQNHHHHHHRHQQQQQHSVIQARKHRRKFDDSENVLSSARLKFVKATSMIFLTKKARPSPRYSTPRETTPRSDKRATDHSTECETPVTGQWPISAFLSDRLVGLVVKASASRAEDPGFESRLRRDFFGVESYQ